MKLDDYKQIANSLIENNRAMRDMRVEYDNMYNLVWDLPANFIGKDWIQKRILKLPYDSVEAGKRAYATMEPNPNIVRPSMNEATHRRYNEIENLLRWQFMRASKRRQPVVATALQYAMLYGEVVMQPIHIDAQTKLIGQISPAKLKGFKKYGDFIINVHNPKDVYVRYTDMGIDAVLLVKVQTVAEFLAFWGDKGKPISTRFDTPEFADKNFVVTYDFMDYDIRAVWADLQATSVLTEKADGYKILLEEHGLPFLPWAAAATPDRQGLLYPLEQSKAWRMANLSETLMTSESISYAAAPRIKVGGTSDEVYIDYGQPGCAIYQAPGQTIEDFPSPQIDQSLAILTDRTRADMQLVPEIVLSGNAPANSAFASINQMMQSGLQTYAPYREVVERALEQVFCLMLDWAKYLNKPLSSPSKSATRGTYGGQFTLKPSQYEYDNEIRVELKPDMPVDRQVQVQTAVNAVNSLGWTRRRANEMLGDNDPEALDKEFASQAIRDAVVGGEIQKITAEKQLEAQATLAGLQSLIALAQDPQGAQMLQQMQQQLQAMAMQAKAPAGGGRGTPPNAANPPGMENMTANPAMGEAAPANFVPGTGSQPMATGQDRGGQQVTQ